MKRVVGGWKRHSSLVSPRKEPTLEPREGRGKRRLNIYPLGDEGRLIGVKWKERRLKNADIQGGEDSLLTFFV